MKVVYINEKAQDTRYIKIDPSQVIVRFTKDFDETEKEAIRKKYPIKGEPIKCSCGDGDLERWPIDPEDFWVFFTVRDGGGHAGVESIPGTGIDPDLEVDPQFKFKIPTANKKFVPTCLESKEIEKLIVKDDKKRVNIAVIDTGIDIGLNKFAKPFLYDTKNVLECNDQLSGWNFVDNNSDVKDNNSHGSYVTRLITSQLELNNVSYSILPVKAFNAEGIGSYWDIVCAMAYIREVHKKKKNIHLVNASFGIVNSFLSMNFMLRVLKSVIDDIDRDILVIASAGNDNEDTDVFGNEHYPSGFTSNNIIGVGQYVEINNQIVRINNYGTTSIDVAAPHIGYSYIFNGSNTTPLEQVPSLIGTSYSAAFTTSRVAKLIFNNYLNDTSLIQNPAKEVKEYFLDEENNWIYIDQNLANYIAAGRYQKLNST